MHLYVIQLNGKTITIDCKDKDTVRSIKCKLQEELGFSIDTIRLIFAGKNLLDEERVCDYNIKDNATLHLVSRLRGNGNSIKVDEGLPLPKFEPDGANEIKCDTRFTVKFPTAPCHIGVTTISKNRPTTQIQQGCLSLIDLSTNQPVPGGEFIVNEISSSVVFMPSDTLLPGGSYKLVIDTSKVYNTNGYMKMNYDTHCKDYDIKSSVTYKVLSRRRVTLCIRVATLDYYIEVSIDRSTNSFVNELLQESALQLSKAFRRDINPNDLVMEYKTIVAGIPLSVSLDNNRKIYNLQNDDIIDVTVNERISSIVEPHVSNTRSISNECCICMEKEVNSILKPCNHVKLCLDCALRIIERDKICPICKTEIQSCDQVYF